ncbi:receptor-type tyrosine-protein phosphatase epsilon-like isoform X3 [Crassostrea virginica]
MPYRYGVFGGNCITKCGQNCKSCDTLHGHCCTGCNPGWKGPCCDKPCDPGFYGYNCSKSCKSHCPIGDGTCDRVTGQCSNTKSLDNLVKLLPEFSGSLASLVVINAGVLLTMAALVIIVVIAIRARRCRTIRVRIPVDTQLSTLAQLEKQLTTPEMDTCCQRKQAGLNSKDVCILCKENGELTREKDFDRLSVETGYTESSDGSFSSSSVTRYDIENEDTTKKSKPARMDTAQHDIPVLGLSDVILEQTKIEEERFKREFNTLPCGEQHKCEAGKLHENLLKNRYDRSFPYDHARVILKGDNDSADYINASYIKGPKSEHDYIATQGPRKNTLNDFWQMVWQEHVTQIVMLTNIYEDGQIKCTQYWPEYMSSRLYGSFYVKKVDEKHYATYVVRKFTLSDKEQQRFRVIMQYHYTMWNGNGTTDPLCLAVFHRHVLRTRSEKTQTPIVVHCSNGMGRTGTYIALDALFKTGKTSGFINVEECVKSMRSSRMDMVLTYEQYKEIYLALNEEFRGSAETLSPADFMEKADNRKEVYPTSETVITEEFKTLMEIRTETTNTDGKFDMRSKKNPLESEEPVIQDSPEHVSRDPFYVSSYTKSDAFIITRYPTPEDAVDFLRMLIDNKSDTVISMEPLREIEWSKAWFPVNVSSKLVGPYLVEQTKLRRKHVSIRKSRKVAFVEPNDSLVSNGEWKDTSYLRSLVLFALNAKTRGPITVVCRDGAFLCGLFCAVFNSVQQIRLDDNVDVFTTVRKLQRQKPEFLSTLDEYLLVHNTVRDYIEADPSIMHNRHQLEFWNKEE